MGSDVQFFALSENVCNKYELPSIPLPVRIGREKDIFKSDAVALDSLLDELENYLIAHPADIKYYREIGVRLATIEGIRLGREGFHEHALHYFEFGLALEPDNVALRTNYALALQGAERKYDAMCQYRFLLQQPAAAVQPLIWIPAARAFMDAGDLVSACQILKHCATFMPTDNEFWELYAQAREQAGVKPWSAPAISEPKEIVQTENQHASVLAEEKPKKNFCSACGKPITPEARFCGGCGREL